MKIWYLKLSKRMRLTILSILALNPPTSPSSQLTAHLTESLSRVNTKILCQTHCRGLLNFYPLRFTKSDQLYIIDFRWFKPIVRQSWNQTCNGKFLGTYECYRKSTHNQSQVNWSILLHVVVELAIILITLFSGSNSIRRRR